MKINKRNIYWLMGKHNMSTFYEVDKTILSLNKLMKAHRRQCENSCNGQGYIPYKGFYRNAYIGNDINVFDAEIKKLEAKIKETAKNFNQLVTDGDGVLKVEFQHDPRGYTVKMFLDSKEIIE